MSSRQANRVVVATAQKRLRTAGSTQVLAMVPVPLIVGLVTWGVMQLESAGGNNSMQSFMDEPERAVGDVSAVADSLASGDLSGGNSRAALDRYNNMNADRDYAARQSSTSSGSYPGQEGGVFAGIKRKLGLGPKAPDVPPWVPVFPGATSEGRIQQETEEGRKGVVRAAVGATLGSVLTFYSNAFEQRGYNFTAEENGGETVISAESPGWIRTATVTISGRGVRRTISIAYMDRT